MVKQRTNRHSSEMPDDFRKALKRLFPDSEAVFQKAAEIMLLKAERCICEVPVGSYYIRLPETYQLKCKMCKLVVSPLSVTPLARDHKSLTDTLDLACRFYYNRKVYSPREISHIYHCKYETAKRKAFRVIAWMKLALPDTKLNNDNKVIRAFVAQHHDLAAAIDSLFNALPSLRVAMKHNSLNK